MLKAILAVNLLPEGHPGDQTMVPLQGLPWKGLGTEAPGQPGMALLPLLVKACGPCSLLWLTMAMTAMKSQTPQVIQSSPACHILEVELAHFAVFICTNHRSTLSSSPSMF